MERIESKHYGIELIEWFMTHNVRNVREFLHITLVFPTLAGLISTIYQNNSHHYWGELSQARNRDRKVINSTSYFCLWKDRDTLFMANYLRSNNLAAVHWAGFLFLFFGWSWGRVEIGDEKNHCYHYSDKVPVKVGTTLREFSIEIRGFKTLDSTWTEFSIWLETAGADHDKVNSHYNKVKWQQAAKPVHRLKPD